MKHFLLILLVFVSASSLTIAQQISLSEAQERAVSFLNSNISVSNRAPGRMSGNEIGTKDLRHVYTATKDEINCFHVFNVGQDQGFVIVGGDESAKTILGSSNRGSFVYEDLPCGLKAMLDYYKEDICQGIKTLENNTKYGRDNCGKSAAKTKAGRHSQEMLLSTQWNQSEPYNRKCRNYGLSYTGCCMTAAAQVMNYFRYYDNGSGTWSNHWMNVKNEDFEAAHFDWEHMRDTYIEGEYTDEEADAVANLMYYLDVAFVGHNAWPGTASTEGLVYDGLVRNLRYSGSLMLVDRNDYTDIVWEDKLYERIVDNREPVLYYSWDHAFILDGYHADNNTFHVNWGWGGNCDGYYAITGSDIESYGYYSHYFKRNNQNAIYNFHKAEILPKASLTVQNFRLSNGEQELYEFDFTQVSTPLFLCFDVNNNSDLPKFVRLWAALDEFDLKNSITVKLEPNSKTPVEIPINLKRLDQYWGTAYPTVYYQSTCDASEPERLIQELIALPLYSISGYNLPYVNLSNVCYFGEGTLSQDLDQFCINGYDYVPKPVGYLNLYDTFEGEVCTRSTIESFFDINYIDWCGEEGTIRVKTDPTIRLKLNSKGFTTLIMPGVLVNLPEYLKLYECLGIDEKGYMILNQVDSAEPFKPYLVYGTPGEYYIPLASKNPDYGYSYNDTPLLGKYFMNMDIIDIPTYNYLTVLNDEAVFVRKTDSDDFVLPNLQAILIPTEGNDLPEIVHIPLPPYPANNVGDANNDGRVDILDIVMVAHFMQDNSVFVSGNADVDCNMLIDDNDVKAIETIVLKP